MGRRRQTILVLAVTITAIGFGSALWAQDKPADESIDDWIFGIGSVHQSIDGNERRFYQYVTPAAEVHLARVEWERWHPGSRLAVDLNLREPGEPGRSGDLWLTWADELTVDGRYRRSSYYFDFEPTSGRSRRRDYDVRLSSAVGPDTRWAWRTRHRQVALRGRPAAGPVDWKQQDAGASFDLYQDGYTVTLQFAREHFDFLTDDLFSGDANLYGVSVASTGYHDTAVTGRLLYRNTDLDGASAGLDHWEALLTISHAVNDKLSLFGELRRRKIDDTIAQRSYARASDSARLEAHYRVHPTTSIKGFWHTSDVDYIDGRGLGLVTAASNTLGLDVKSRFSPEFKFRGKFRQQDVDDRPLSYPSGGGLADTVVYSTRQRTDLSLSYTPLKAPAGVTVQWQRDSWDNDAQDLENTVDTTAATAWWQWPWPNLSMTASYIHQDFDLPITDPVLGGFVSRAESVVLGANYQASRYMDFYATYADAIASGASGTDYESVTLGMNYETSPRDRVSAEVTFGDYDDLAEHSLDYGADLYSIEWQREF